VQLRRAGRSAFASFTTMEAAAAWRAAWLDAVARGVEPPEPQGREAPVISAPTIPVTVADAARELITGMVTGAARTRRGHRYKPATIREYEERLRLYVLPRVGALHLVDLRRGDVRRMIDEVAAEVSASAALLSRDVLGVVCALQVEREVIEANPCLRVAGPSPERRKARFLTPAEADRLQEVADRDPHHAIGAYVRLALASGLRNGELRALLWGPEGLDPGARRVHVVATEDAWRTRGTPKGRKDRVVPLGSEIATAMLRFRMAEGRPDDGTHVFPARMDHAWERVRTAADLPELRHHDLRHTCATFWLAAGLTVHAVAELLGHADAALVLRLYGHALKSELDTAGDRLEAWRLSPAEG
jgi:integrase